MTAFCVGGHGPFRGLNAPLAPHKVIAFTRCRPSPRQPWRAPRTGLVDGGLARSIQDARAPRCDDLRGTPRSDRRGTGSQCGTGAQSVCPAIRDAATLRLRASGDSRCAAPGQAHRVAVHRGVRAGGALDDRRPFALAAAGQTHRGQTGSGQPRSLRTARCISRRRAQNAGPRCMRCRASHRCSLSIVVGSSR